MKTCPHCHKSLLVNCGLCACGCGETVWAHSSTANRSKGRARFYSKKCANRWHYQARALVWYEAQKAIRGAK